MTIHSAHDSNLCSYSIHQVRSLTSKHHAIPKLSVLGVALCALSYHLSQLGRVLYTLSRAKGIEGFVPVTDCPGQLDCPEAWNQNTSDEGR